MVTMMTTSQGYDQVGYQQPCQVQMQEDYEVYQGEESEEITTETESQSTCSSNHLEYMKKEMMEDFTQVSVDLDMNKKPRQKKQKTGILPERSICWID